MCCENREKWQAGCPLILTQGCAPGFAGSHDAENLPVVKANGIILNILAEGLTASSSCGNIESCCLIVRLIGDRLKPITVALNG